MTETLREYMGKLREQRDVLIRAAGQLGWRERVVIGGAIIGGHETAWRLAIESASAGELVGLYAAVLDRRDAIRRALDSLPDPRIDPELARAFRRGHEHQIAHATRRGGK